MQSTAIVDRSYVCLTLSHLFTFQIRQFSLSGELNLSFQAVDISVILSINFFYSDLVALLDMTFFFLADESMCMCNVYVSSVYSNLSFAHSLVVKAPLLVQYKMKYSWK